ncbi:MAG: ribosome biogenesis GTP-binding protein YihA/YsxC [Bacilli bacterium]|jgi:GTP-binding protein|nr:ribosome biogenesis GTP-binding protein YihA/YsxC [Bacilli bacterium]MDD3348368.1 ribosome biogenesis GTP-binding protein YihA/YsxC [Bacilli bacterium]MDY0209132.1 ribosome biogenesis GTP-binding protein YihA/YsxC [Bacilli bacterium]
MFDKCEYIISAVGKEQFPNTNKLAEFVFLGRSNVGKSSFINALSQRKMLARTSSKPGKTQTINFFLIDEAFYLVDVPGYGYANRSRDSRLNYGEYIEAYLTDNSNLKIVFLLVDTKVGPTNDDVLMMNYLRHLALNIVVIGTKADKVGTTMLAKQKALIKQLLIVNDKDIILTSAATKYGLDKVIGLLLKQINPSN